MKTKLVVVAATVLIAWALKRHYADARADDLWWILAPTAQLAGVITATPFEMQTGEGYLSRERLFLIEKSCAGVNFIIAAFGMLMFARFHRVASPLSAARLLGASLLVAYVVTVVVNAAGSQSPCGWPRTRWRDQPLAPPMSIASKGSWCTSAAWCCSTS